MFGKKSNKPALIFVVEDNTMYAKTLQAFLKSKFPETVVEVFPVGELAIDNLGRNPDYIVMDYYLDSKYYDAADGLSMIKEIKAKNPKINIIALTSQQDINVALAVKDAGCSYLVKNDEAFKKLEELIQAGKH